MRPLKKLRYGLEVLGLRLALFLVPLLPRRAILGLAGALGSLGYVLAGHLRNVGLANLDIAFGDTLTAHEKRRILRQSFRTIALVSADSFWFTRHTEARVTKYVRFDEYPPDLFERKAQICMTAHIGNWEVLGLAIAVRGCPLTIVADRLANPSADRILHEIRSRMGQTSVPRRGAVKELLRTLREGGKPALLLDQNTRPSAGGVFVDFFGLPVPVSTVAASLALRTGSDIVFGYCYPQPDRTYSARVEERLKPVLLPGETTKDAVHRVTQEITNITEREVRRHPEHWQWIYKRWKHVAPGVPRERYPFYARWERGHKSGAGTALKCYNNGK